MRDVFITLFALQVFPFTFEQFVSKSSHAKIIEDNADLIVNWRKSGHDIWIGVEKLLGVCIDRMQSVYGLNINYWTDYEVTNFIDKDIKPTLDMIAERGKNYLCIIEDFEAKPLYSVYSGEMAEKASAQLVLKTKENLSSKALKGKVIYGKNTRGIVYVVQKKIDFASIPKDAIVVAKVVEMDDFVFLKNSKAKAVITEEGGLTTHIAINGRELKIPIMIGVKNVTQVLKDGDLVEVDVEKGVVKILEK